MDICFIQEVHYTSTLKETWAKDWDGDMYFSGNNSRSTGVGILLNNTLNIKVNNSIEIIEGRILVLNTALNGKRVTLINVNGCEELRYQ